MIRLLTIDPAFSGQACEVPEGVFSVGRRGDNDIVVAHPTVSARHCELLVHGLEVIVRDLGGRNGIFVDEVEVRAQGGIRHGQSLRLGSVRLLVQVEVPTDPDRGETTGILAYRRWLRSAGQGARFPPRFPRFLIPNLPA